MNNENVNINSSSTRDHNIDEIKNIIHLVIAAEYEQHWQGIKKFRAEVVIPTNSPAATTSKINNDKTNNMPSSTPNSINNGMRTINTMELKLIILQKVHTYINSQQKQETNSFSIDCNNSTTALASTVVEENEIIEIYDEEKKHFISLDDCSMNTSNTKEVIKCLSYNTNTINRKKLIRCQILHTVQHENKSEQKLIMGRYFPIDEKNGIPFANGSTTIYINEIQNNQINDTGWNVWDGSMLLIRFLEKYPEKVKSKRVLELGSGCGLAGIACSILGAKEVIMTDLPYTISNMEQNIERNIVSSHSENNDNSKVNIIKCQVCDWFHPCPIDDFQFTTSDVTSSSWVDVILVADCIWINELVLPFLSTLEMYITASASSINVILSYQRRAQNIHELFWNGLHDIFDEVVEIQQQLGLDGLPDCFFLLECRRFIRSSCD